MVAGWFIRKRKESMRALNYVGNKFFGLMFSWILGQPIKDTLCGTKVLWRIDYEDIMLNRKFSAILTLSAILICFSERQN